MQPLFSICVPTFARADLLREAIRRLGALEQCGASFEIVVSDNASSDGTAQVLETAKATMPYLRSSRQTVTVGAFQNYLNAIRNAAGVFVVYVADDDSLIPENLMRHIARMEREPDLAAVYCDWIAWDDENEREMHRYFHFKEAVSFTPGDSLGLMNFAISNLVFPEIAVYRREVFLRAFRHTKHTYPFLLWMYRVARQGRIAFDLLPFYREHRVLKSQFRRTHWANMDLQLHIIGDEMRNSLESLMLMALQDASMTNVPEDQALKARLMIDRYLHARNGLEIQRAQVARNWILGVELRQRHVLWYGPGNSDDQYRDLMQLAFPAALQSVKETFESLSDVSGLLLRGFVSPEVEKFFRTHFPDVPLLQDPPATSGPRPLILYRNAPPAPPDDTHPGYVLSLDQLLETYRVHKHGVNLATL